MCHFSLPPSDRTVLGPRLWRYLCQISVKELGACVVLGWVGSFGFCLSFFVVQQCKLNSAVVSLVSE